MAISRNNSIFKKLEVQKAFKIGKAIDLGCGKGGDAKAFANAGFFVTAIDKSTDNISNLEKIIKDESLNIQTVAADISNYTIEKESYELVSSQYTLQFLDKEVSKNVISNMIYGSVSAGIIIFTLIGERDEWKDKWSTWNKEDAISFLKKFPIEFRNIIEEEGVDATQAGPFKWWHVITFVLIKNSH